MKKLLNSVPLSTFILFALIQHGVSNAQSPMPIQAIPPNQFPLNPIAIRPQPQPMPIQAIPPNQFPLNPIAIRPQPQPMPIQAIPPNQVIIRPLPEPIMTTGPITPENNPELFAKKPVLQPITPPEPVMTTSPITPENNPDLFVKKPVQ